MSETQTKPRRGVAWVLAAIAIGGLALFVTLLLRHGVADIAGAVAAARWGVLAVIVVHTVPLMLDAMGWRALIAKQDRLPYWRLLELRWIGDSVSAMLPVAQVGGEVVRVRLAAARGMRISTAAATVIAGMTVCVATQIVFTLSGLGMLIARTGSSTMLWPAIGGTAIFAAAIGGFYAVQRVGIFRILSGMAKHLLKSESFSRMLKDGQALDTELHRAYERRRGLIESSFWNLAVWVTGAVEVWIALRAVGIPASFMDAFILESASQAIRSAFFVVPGALGVQEGGYVVIGAMLGIDAPTALALALIRRAREVAFGVPGVIAWQIAEGKHWLRRRSLAPAMEQSP
ncbi:MAG TPA: flippase-like domain-containing protein [Phycisphaerae bacterium]|nr:flippase-like domain-containing protein [Phycisphaerae bacterium]